MSSSTAERIKALEVALNNESRERDFYLKHAERTNNSFGKMMFQSLERVCLCKTVEFIICEFVQLLAFLRAVGAIDASNAEEIEPTSMARLVADRVAVVDINSSRHFLVNHQHAKRSWTDYFDANEYNCISEQSEIQTQPVHEYVAYRHRIPFVLALFDAN